MENLEEFIKKPLNLLRSGKEAAIITKRNRKNNNFFKIRKEMKHVVRNRRTCVRYYYSNPRRQYTA